MLKEKGIHKDMQIGQKAAFFSLSVYIGDGGVEVDVGEWG